MRYRSQFAIIFSLLLTIGASGLALGADYYVDADAGDDGNDGSEGSPWLTITYALDWIASNDPGSEGNAHTIHVAAGTYAASTNGETYPLNMQSWVSLEGDSAEATILDAEEGAYHVIYCYEADNLTIAKLSITGGYADGPDENDRKGAGIHCWHSSPIIMGDRVTGNVTDGDDSEGGGIYCYYGSPVVEDNDISGNAADGEGGGISCRYSSPNITDNSISENSVGNYGGGVSFYYGSPMLEGNDISDNSTEYCGGGLYVFHASAIIRSNTIRRNSTPEAYYWGGGIYSYGGTASCIMESNTISDNSAGSGGGICCIYSSPIIGDNDIRDNKSTDNGPEDNDGGGIYCTENSSPTIINNTITGNAARSSGGGIRCDSDSSPTIESNSITGNSAYMAGGISCVGGSPTIQRNDISENAGRWGAGISCSKNSSPTIYDNSVAENSGGSGLWLHECSSLVSHNIISANTGGAGVYYTRGSSTIADNVITGNAPSGGIYCIGGSASIANNTISNNAAGVYNYAGDAPKVIDCIIWENGDDLYGCSATYCCIQDEDEGEGNIHDDPDFVTGPHGDYYLDTNSPCIDAGSQSAADAGLDDRTTQVNGTYDSGTVDMGYHYPTEGGNYSPQLSDGDVDPDSGTTETTFVYSVHYYDQDGDEPTVKDVYIDDEAHEMDGSGADGTYTYSTKLSAGDHEFYFYFEDGNGGSDRDPSSGTYEGPTVTGNESDYYVDPVNGDDDNDGTEDHPWLTITHALETVEGSEANPVTVHALAGTFAASTNGETFPLNMESWVSLTGEDAQSSILDAEDDAYHVIYCGGVNHLKIEGLTITGGNAEGGVYPHFHGGGVACENSSPTIQHNNITCNEARVSGGGIGCLDYSSPTIQSNTITDNSGNYGGGIYCNDSSPAILQNLIVGNEAGTCGGGVRCWKSSSPLIEDNTIETNSAPFGGGISCENGASPSIHNNTIADNQATGEDGTGGAIYCYESSSAISNNTISYNSADDNGGGIACLVSSPAIESNVINGNTAAEKGGGIYCNESSPTITDNTISNNSVEGASWSDGGGGIFCDSCSPIIQNNSITGNEVTGTNSHGGGIYCGEDSCPAINDNAITANSVAVGWGGGLYCVKSSPIVENNAISNNSVILGPGGGVACYFDSSPTLVHNTISGNTASSSGGGIDCWDRYCSPTIHANTIVENSARSGGGICFTLGIDSNPVVKNNTIAGNVAEDNGGGIFCFQFSSPTISNNEIVNNTAGASGGGIHCNDDSSPMIMDNTVSGNLAGSVGGGVYCYNRCSPTILNSVLWKDSPEEVYVGYSSSITITYSDIEGGWEGEGNIDEDPLFVDGYYLSQTAAGQNEQSPCVDAGDDDASEYGLDTYTTRTDQVPDSGIVDMGYHYEREFSGPQLSNQSYSPNYGRTDTDFTFTVDYYSEDGFAPDTIEVTINGTAHDMTLDSGDADDGTYSWTGTIPEEGTAQYHFECDDGHDGEDRMPDSGELDGPEITNDYDPPASSCTAPERTQSGSISVDYTSSDTDSGVAEVALWMQFNGGGYNEIDSSDSAEGAFNVSLNSGNGTYDFYTIATDNVGNEEEAPGTPDATTLFDDTPPISSASAEQYSNSTPFCVDFTASDALSGVKTTALWFSFEGAAWTDSGLMSGGETGTFSFNPSSGEGSYALYTISTDNNDNVESPPASADCTVVYDLTKPQSSCTCEDMTNQTTISVDYSASDDNAIAEVSLWFSFNDGTWTFSGKTKTSASGTFSFTFPSGEGEYRFYTLSRDVAGNVEGAPSTADDSIFADFTMPQSQCYAEDYAKSVPFDVQFESSDGASGVASTRLYFRYAGDTNWGDSYCIETGKEGTFHLDPSMGEGEIELMTIATDNVGNKESPPGAPDDTITLDMTAPVSSCETDLDCTSAATVRVDYSASDGLAGIALVRLFVSRDASEWEYSGYESDQVAGYFDYDFAGLDGTFRFVTVASDNADNVEDISDSKASTVNRDTGLPTSTLTSPEFTNDASFEVEYQITDAVSGGYGVKLYMHFSTSGTTALDAEGTAWKGRPTPTPLATDWEYTGLYERGEMGSIKYEPPYGPGVYELFTIARDKAGNFEEMKDAAETITEYNPEYALSTCWSPSDTSAATIDVEFEIDIGDEGYDHVELWYMFSSDGEDWPETYTNTTLTSDAESGTFDFEPTEGDGIYRFCTIALNQNMLAEPFPRANDCETKVDCSPPSSELSGPSLSGSIPVTISYDASDLIEEGTYCSRLASLELWYSMDESTVPYDCIPLSSATVATGSIEFSPVQEGAYGMWSVAIDEFGNREEFPSEPDFILTVDLAAPTSSASCDGYGKGFPVSVAFVADDTMTEVETVELWARYESGNWEDTDLSSSGDSGTFYYTPETVLEGTYYFYTIATDEAGHTEAAPGTPDAQIVIDWTAPETTCTSPEYSSDATVELTYTASDGLSGMNSVSAWVKVGSGAWQDTGLTGPGDGGVINVNLFAWGEGIFGLCTLGRDNSGNVENLPEIVPTTIIYDATAPDSAAELPPDGIYANYTPIDVPYAATDALSGVDEVELWFSHDGSDWEDSGLLITASSISFMGQGSFQFVPPHGDGTYHFDALATDNAGNRESLSGQPDGGALVFDQTEPYSSVTYGNTYASEFPFELPFKANDALSGVQEVSLFASINGSTFADTGLRETDNEGSFEYMPDVVADGIYSFYSIVTDNAGNVEETPSKADATVIFDLDAPVSSAQVDDDYSISFPVYVSYSASDTASGIKSVALWVRVNGGQFIDSGLSSAIASGAFSYTPSTPADGLYEFYTIATDKAGGTESAPSGPDDSIIVDSTKPTSSCSIEPALTNSFPIQIHYTSSDALSGVDQVRMYYRIDYGPWLLADELSDPEGDYGFTIDTMRDGYYEFYTKAYDKATNAEKAAGADDAVTVDRTPPISATTSPSRVQEVPFYVLFTAHDSSTEVANTKLWYEYEDGPWIDTGLNETGTVGQFEFNCPDGEGTYGFYTVCTDIAGNIEKSPNFADSTTEYHVPRPEISANKSSIDFGEVNTGERGTQMVTVKNVGDADLTVESITSDNSVFEPSFDGDLPIALEPNERLEIDVTFAPVAEGIFDGALEVISDDPDTPSLMVTLSGEGVEVSHDLTVEVWPSSNEVSFGDELAVNIAVQNTGETVNVDAYVILSFDLGGPAERNWSASLLTADAWTDGLAPLVTDYEIPAGLDLELEWWSSTLPCELPMIDKSGAYTLRMAAVEPGTLNLVSNLATSEFIVFGELSIRPSTDKATYAPTGDTIVMYLDIDVPHDLTVDAYLVLLAPNGQFWSPAGFGYATWTSGMGPMLSGISLPGGYTFSGPVLMVTLPPTAPFDTAGQFTVCTALSEPGTMSLITDIEMSGFSLD
ncbi:MAG: right-handed parallel beta-helix repeat-containing protein [Candidatus Coatesbacteria bacterium]|nr:right-handed parallel beta-helix repeat-containing protein [Candidatus Coatesbacteria bacterium]